jgi:hypothetical protein
MKAHGSRDAISSEALSAIEALESEHGSATDFIIADTELRRLEWHWDLRHTVNLVAMSTMMAALNALERPLSYIVVCVVSVSLFGFYAWWGRTARARAVMRVKQAIHDWLAFGRSTHDESGQLSP